jgi:proteasome lid subunit RPN8/RPN11
MAEMNLHIHHDHLQSLARHLARAQRLEIGGVLVGEHLSENVFRVADLSFQRATGTEACFERRPEEHKKFFATFFERTGSDFQRFNYLGEWHSHPTFATYPSDVDRVQMQAIVENEPNGPIFSVLIIVRLAGDATIELSATAYRRGCEPSDVAVQLAPRPPDDPTRVRPPWWRRILERGPTEVDLMCVSAGVMCAVRSEAAPTLLAKARAR